MIDAPLVRPPRLRAVRMAAWAPAARISGPTPGRKSLGFLGLTLNFDETTVLSAALGGAGVLFSDAFDPPASTLVKIGGFLALGYAVYHLFGGGTPAGATGTPGGPSHVVGPNPEGPPNAPHGSAYDLRGSIITPAKDSFAEVGTRAGYPIQFSIRNAGDLPVSAIVKFQTTEYPRLIGWSNDSRETLFTVDLGPGQTKVYPGTQPYAFGRSLYVGTLDVVAQLVASTPDGKVATLASTSFMASQA